MLTYNSTFGEIRKVFAEEEPKALYWIKKRYQGDKGFERECDRLARICYNTYKQRLSGEITRYQSKENEWLSWIRVQRNSKGEAYAMPMCVVYFETAKYMGVISNTFSTDGITGISRYGFTIYTPHFFQRIHERLGVDMTNRREVARNFIDIMGMSPTRYADDNLKEFVKRLPGSWARGDSYTEGDSFVDTVRTYYTDKTLTSVQRKDLQSFGKFIDEMKGLDAMLGDAWEYMYLNNK